MLLGTPQKINAPKLMQQFSKKPTFNFRSRNGESTFLAFSKRTMDRFDRN